MGPNWQRQQEQMRKQQEMGAWYEQQRRKQQKGQAWAPQPGLGDRFAEVEREVAKLRRDLAAGHLTKEQFRARLRELMVQDAQGGWWMMGVESDTWYRQIAIDGRYRDFPIWSFVIPGIVLMAWKTLTIVRADPVPRADRWAKALSFGRLLGYDGSRGFVRMDRSFSRITPVLPEMVLKGPVI